MRHSLLALLLASVCAGSPAAAQPSAAAAEIAPSSGAALAWPSREAALVREVEVGPWQLRWVGQFPLGEAEPEEAASEAIRSALGEPGRELLFEGEGSVIVRMPMGELSATARVAGKPAAAYVYTSASEAGGEALRVQRTWFALYEPKGRGASEGEPGAKGLVVLLPGMFGTPEPVVDSLVGMLRGRGWHVLRMLTHPARFTEKASYMLVPGGDLASVAGQIAREMNDRVGECAFAVDAVCEKIAESRAGVPVDRRVGLGLSGGGMVLSTVVAHDPGAYTGAVFIGAGCDFAQIAIESNYTDWIDSIRILWESEPGEAAREAFAEAYRSAAVLDSYTTATLFPEVPVLMIHGEADQAVPAAMGDLLWERLGRPERWTQPIGHEALFLAYLPTRAAALLDWIDERCAP